MDDTWQGARAVAGLTDQPIPPAGRLLLLTSGKRISQVIYALAVVNVADAVADGPLPVDRIAERTGTDPGALFRLLRCAAAVGVFAEQPDGSFGLTDLADAMRSDVPYSQRDMILFNGSEVLWEPYGRIVDSLRTGKPVFPDVFGTDFFTYLRENPGTGAVFDRAMTRMSAATTRQFLGSYDFGRYARVADIGGGRGYFLAELLRAFPAVRGTLVDQPQVVADAAAAFAERGVADRVTVCPGDFFAEVPAGHDAYLLKAVLHDWDDEDATAILRQIRRAVGAGDTARLLVLEQVLAPGNEWDHGKFLDIDMLLRFGGRERDLRQWRELLAAGGFELVNQPAAGRWAVLECRPV